jgi:4-hydroxyphenylpyruvate dioxygenase
VIRFSFNTWNHSAASGLAPSLPEQIAAAANAGWDHIGLDMPSLIAHNDGGIPAEAIRDELEASAITCFEIVPLSISHDQRATQESVVAIRSFGTAVGAQHVLAVARGPISPALIENTRRAAEQLADLGLSVAIEFLPTIDVNSIDMTRTLIDAARVPTLGVMVDSWHFFAGPSTWRSLEDLPAEQLGFVQFSDAAAPVTSDLAHEYRERRVLPGQGIHDLAGFADAVKRKRPDVTVSVEVLSQPWRERPATELISASLAASQPFWQ